MIHGDWNWRHAVAKSDLPSTTKLVLLVISLHASEAGAGIFPSIRRISEQASLSKRAVQRHLDTAIEMGWILREDRFDATGRQTSNAYRLTSPHHTRMTDQGEGERGAPRGDTRVMGEGDTSVTLIPLSVSEGKSEELSLDLEIEPEPEPVDYDCLLDRLWALHPRGTKYKAAEQIKRKVPSRVSEVEIEAALALYVATEITKTFRGHDLWRWIRDERWEQERAKKQYRGGSTRRKAGYYR